MDHRPTFGVDHSNDSRKPIPKWVPVTLLAVSTAALAFPIIMLRRHRVGKALTNAPPPPRRTSSLNGAPIAHPTASRPVYSIRDSLPSSSSSRSLPSAAKADDGFNAPLQFVKAFSIATFLVGVGATATVWGLRQYMGVQTTQEFADRMRQTILTRIPILSARIYRTPEPEDGDAPLTLASSPHATSSSPSPDITEPWTWPAAEQRLKEAFEKHGFYGWVAAAIQELEAEGRIERSKRGHV